MRVGDSILVMNKNLTNNYKPTIQLFRAGYEKWREEEISLNESWNYIEFHQMETTKKKLISGSWESTIVPQTTFETKQLSFPLCVVSCVITFGNIIPCDQTPMMKRVMRKWNNRRPSTEPQMILVVAC